MAQAHADGPVLSQIFSFNMLDAQVAYLEAITGPAWRVYPDVAPGTQERVYQVAGCQVTVGVVNGAVRYLGTDLASTCDVNLNRFIDRTQPIPPASTMTFGEFENAVGHGSFAADCLNLCGNSYDPSVHDNYVGPQSDDNLEVVASVKLVDDASIKASEKWETIMERQNGQAYVLNTTFNCDGRYDAQAAALFQNVRITSITIGWNLTGPGTSCKEGTQ